MYPYMNEDAAFERLKDLQREMENSRRVAGSIRDRVSFVRSLAARAWWLGGLAMRRAPRRRPIKEQQSKPDLPGQQALGG
jgi:hypothetical protein